MVSDLNVNELMGRERRQFYRVGPSVEEPIVLKTGDGNFPLIEISGGGCRLPIAAQLSILETDLLDLCLPGISNAIKVRLRTMNADEKSFGVEFVELDPQLREVICNYVRSREIELVRRFRDQASSSC